MAGVSDLLNRTCMKDLVTAMEACPHTAVGRATLVQGAANGAARFFPLKRRDAVLSAGDAVVAGLHHGAFTRSPSVQVFRRDIALQLPVLCDARFERFVLEELAFRLMIPGGLVVRAGRCGVRPPPASASQKQNASSGLERVARYGEECALKIHALKEFTRSKTLRYNRTFVGMLLLRLSVFRLVDTLAEDHAAGEQGAHRDDGATLEQVYNHAAAELRVMERDVSARLHEEARASCRRGDTVQAIAQLESLVADAPYYGAAHNDLCVLFYERGDVVRSLVHSKQAVALAPDDANALRHMASLLAVSSRKADAAQPYQRLLAIASNDPAACQSLAALCSPACADTSASISSASVSSAH